MYFVATVNGTTLQPRLLDLASQAFVFHAKRLKGFYKSLCQNLRIDILDALLLFNTIF
jgi:hypothetical protein